MRTLLKISVPVETGNQTIKNGELPKVIQQTMERIKPEAAYFTTLEGRRTGLFFFDLKDVSDIPSIGEPFFMTLNATVEFCPVMNPEDLQKGLDKAMANR